MVDAVKKIMYRCLEVCGVYERRNKKENELNSKTQSGSN